MLKNQPQFGPKYTGVGRHWESRLYIWHTRKVHLIVVYMILKSFHIFVFTICHRDILILQVKTVDQVYNEEALAVSTCGKGFIPSKTLWLLSNHSWRLSAELWKIACTIKKRLNFIVLSANVRRSCKFHYYIIINVNYLYYANCFNFHSLKVRCEILVKYI